MEIFVRREKGKHPWMRLPKVLKDLDPIHASQLSSLIEHFDRIWDQRIAAIQASAARERAVAAVSLACL
jgi:hypothetical protein